MKILISGFEPFGGRDVNNAWEIARQFIGKDNIDVIKIPVSFEYSHKRIIDSLEKKKYDFILILGETAWTTEYVRLERLAINYKDSLAPDNYGIIADDEEILLNAPKAYFSPVHVKRVTSSLKEKGYKVKVTNSTGTFVCNSVYYNILHYVSEQKLPVKVLFIHLPASTEIVSLEEMRETIENVISNIEKI